MAHHPERYIGTAFVLLVFSVVAPQALDWWRANHRPPPGYSAGEDRTRTNPIPGPVRATVKEQSAGVEASWVKEVVENGTWTYELHVLKDRKWSVIHINSNGNVIPRNPASGATAGAGG